MNISKNIIGKKFGRLTVLSKADSILGGKTVKRFWGAWNCICDCGNTIIVKTIHLNRGGVKSCGCLISQYGVSIKPGQKINRLTAISYKRGKWFCHCECGNTVDVPTDRLNNNNTKSCGCLKIEVSKNKSDKLIEGRRQFDPRIASARRVWKRYCYSDNQCINFNDFIIISQKRCFYCGIAPSTKYNNFEKASSRGSIKAKEAGDFIYNGIDRIDASKYHTEDNIVACCYDCNRAKNNRSIDQFYNWINDLKIKHFKPINIKLKQLPENGSLLTSIKCVFYNYKKDADISLQEYYSLSQMNCFYCKIGPSNIFNKAKTDKKSSEAAKLNGNYIYNGIDRVDRNYPHNKNNIVPCCKYCNFSKSKLPLEEFYSWIDRIKKYQKMKLK